MLRSILLGCWLARLAAPLGAQLPPDVAPFVSVNASVVVLNHVRVIDGTGAAPKEDQTIVLADGLVRSIGPSGSTQAPAGAQVLDRTGYSVVPGLVGMHDHLYYTASYSAQIGDHGELGEPGLFIAEIPYTAPRLYLAAGVTTMRSTGSLEPYADLKLKQRIDAGLMPGPAIDASAPYLEGPHSRFAQMHELSGPEDARRLVDYWAGEGMTSFKAYMNITRDELGAAIQEAHAHKMKLTGHLCSVTWPEAIALGIADLEHGPVFTDTEFMSPSPLHCLCSKLPFPCGLPSSSGRSRRCLQRRRRVISPPGLAYKEMDFELAFAKAGGLLLAGPDPTGNGGVLPGFGDQREVELLVEAGFSPVEAIHIATENGAVYLGRQDRIGALAAGKQADLVLIKGDPSKNINDIENVETVFKAGIGYDSEKLIQIVRGQVGIR
jgi:cytosine/adenosine deaminase-related metal-dependent hydrolase